MRFPRIFLIFLCCFGLQATTHASVQCLRWDLNQTCGSDGLSRIEWRVRCNGGTPAVGMTICATNMPRSIGGGSVVGNSLYPHEMDFSGENKQCFCRKLAPELSQYVAYVQTFSSASECETGCSYACSNAVTTNANGRARWTIMTIDSLATR